MDDAPRSPAASWRAGVRDALPYTAAGCLLAISFGALARDVGLAWWIAVVMSAVVFAGAAQFAAITIVAAGGGIGAAIVAAALVNARYLPMGVALGPSLSGGRLRRAAQGQVVVDAAWVMAADGKGGFDRHYLWGHTGLQYCGWIAGTLIGAIGGDVIGDPKTIGLDAVFPAFFLVLLIGELRRERARGVAALGALIALVLVPVAPAGLPVLVAGAAALVGLLRRDGSS